MLEFKTQKFVCPKSAYPRTRFSSHLTSAIFERFPSLRFLGMRWTNIIDYTSGLGNNLRIMQLVSIRKINGNSIMDRRRLNIFGCVPLTGEKFRQQQLYDQNEQRNQLGLELSFFVSVGEQRTPKVPIIFTLSPSPYLLPSLLRFPP